MESSPIDEIKNRLDILEVIGSYIRLEKAGRNYRARCPFHSEKSPSFMVSPERQIWHCFGCGLGGDIFAFVRQIDGVEFGDALRTLAHRAGVALKRQDPTVQTQRKHLYEVCELAAKFFQKQLEASTSGKKALNYLLKDRGLKPETIKEWRLGWAPDEWRAQSDFLKTKGYNEKEIFDAGLIVKKEGVGDYYDRFRSRIMFPLFDIQGQIVGFAGRIFGKDDPNAGKYVNTPQTVLYDKSRILYGLNFAKMETRQKNSCILVEGNLDVIMSHQAGVKNAVASSGTALTQEHLKIIRRYTDNLLFAFDMDPAGDNATRRSIDLALESDFGIKIIQMAEKDTADMVKHDPSSWQKTAEQAVSIMEYYFSSTLTRFKPDTPESKKQIAKILLPVIKRISNQIEQAHWIGELAKKIKTDEKIIYSELKKLKSESTPVLQNNATSAPPRKPRLDELEERLLALYLNFPEHLNDLKEEPQEFLYTPDLIEILKALREIAEKEPKEKCAEALKKKLKNELSEKIGYLSLLIEKYPVDEKKVGAEIDECVKELKLSKIKEAMAELSLDIQGSKPDDNKKKLEKFNIYSARWNELNNPAEIPKKNEKQPPSEKNKTNQPA